MGLTLDEQRSHFALWCLASAPLLAGTDLIHASNDTLAILTAKGPLSVQADAGLDGRVQGTLVLQTKAVQLWHKPLSDGAHALILLNALADKAQASASLSAAKLSPDNKYRVTDLWTGKDMGTISGSNNITATLDSHAALFVRLE